MPARVSPRLAAALAATTLAVLAAVVVVRSGDGSAARLSADGSAPTASSTSTPEASPSATSTPQAAASPLTTATTSAATQPEPFPVTEVALPESDPPCPAGSSALPPPASQTTIDVGDGDVREVAATSGGVWLSVLRRGAVHLRGVTASGPQKTAVREEFVLVASSSRIAYGVETKSGDLVAIDLVRGGDAWTRSGLQLAPRAGARVLHKVLTAAVSGEVLYVLGVPDPAVSSEPLWLAAVDASTGTLRWSKSLTGLRFPGWDYVPHVGLTTMGADAVVAVPDFELPGLRVLRVSPGGAQVAERGLRIGGSPGVPRLVADGNAVYLAVLTPLPGSASSDAGLLLRLDSRLHLTATQPARPWNVYLTSRALWLDSWNCQQGALSSFDPVTLEPTGGLTVGGSFEYDLDVRDGTLWLVTQGAQLLEGTVLRSYSL